MSTRTVAILFVAAIVYLLGNQRVQLWDRDEPRYAQASRQMLQSGDWVVPKLLDEPRINKPPLIYWAQASAMAIFGDNAFAARLPSVLAMLATIAILAIFFTRELGEERAFWATLIFATSGLVIMSAKMCLTDSVLLLFITISQICVYAMYRGRATWPVVITFSIATGLGFLTKGPVTLGVNATTILVLLIPILIRRWRSRAQSQISNPKSQILPVTLKILASLAIIAAIISPWIYMMQLRIPGGLANTFRHDVVKRMTTALESHKGPPGYYLLFFFASFFPWSLLLPTAVKVAILHRRLPILRFSLAAIIGPWIMFEIIQTKLPHYVLPVFPFLALITADALVRCIHKRHDDLHRRAFLPWVALWGLLLIFTGLALWVANDKRVQFPDLPFTAMAVIGLCAWAGALLVFFKFVQRDITAAAYSMAGTMLVLFALLFAWYLPNARFLHLSADIGAYLQQIGATQPGDVQMIDYKEDSLPFYQGGTIRQQPKNAYLAQTPPEDWPAYFVITRRIWNETPPEKQARLEVLRTFRGWAYANRGKIVEVMVVKKRG